MDTEARLKQIEKIAQNARTTWFGLLALLVFVGVTLMGHKDSDFFAYGAATTLPIVGIDVPPTAFFIAAPILTAALYCYLHIYLLGLWDALGKIDQPQPRKTQPLGNLVYPILFTIAALWYRNALRGDGAMQPRVLGMWTVIIAVLLGWVFGWVVLGFAWWRSMPAHDPLIAIVSGLSLWAAVDFGVNGFLWAERTLRDAEAEAPAGIRGRRIFASGLLVTALILVSVQRSGVDLIVDSGTGLPILMARADLDRARLTQEPRDWIGYQTWLDEFELSFRKREALRPRWRLELEKNGEDWSPELKDRFREEASLRWAALTQSLRNSNLDGRDLRGAEMSRVFLAGGDLRHTNMDGANLIRARISGGVFRDASLRNANLERARLEGALFAPRKEGKLRGSANLENANLRRSRLDDAFLNQAHLVGADLGKAKLPGTDVAGWNIERASLRSTDLSTARNLSQSSLDVAFGDAGTKLPTGFQRPCHWDQGKFDWDADEVPDLLQDQMYLDWVKGGAVSIARNPQGRCSGDHHPE